MDFRLDTEQQALQAAAKDFCTKEITSTVVRSAFESPNGDSPELYKKMAELGWLAITLPESAGGAGMGPIEQAVICQALGYRVAPGPWFSTSCLAIPALVALGAPELAGPLSDGSKRAAVAWDLDDVVDAQIADAILAVQNGKAVWHEDFTVKAHGTIDGTRRTGTVTLGGKGRELGPASVLEFGDTAGVMDAAAIALCAEMVGGMYWALETTVQYLKDREAFGRPIGVFQALQHRAADMLIKTESSYSATYYAAYAHATGLPDAAYAASIAKAYTSDASLFVTGECIQLHGGIGFTWEHDAHLYFKRATTNQSLLGNAEFHRERVLRLDPQQ